MTTSVQNDSRTICRIKLTGEDRWVSLSLSLGELGSATRFVVSSEGLLYDLAGADDTARMYGLSNWQGGIISGARYAFRALRAPLQQVCIHELRGRLNSGDIWAVSSGAAIAVARLLARSPEFPLELNGWKTEEEIWRSQSTQAVSQSEKIISPQPEQTNLTSLAGQPGKNGGTQDRPAEPIAPVEQ
jgi:hypothetical protein